MRRKALAFGGLVVLLALAGCLGPTQIPEKQLTGNASYDWETNATVSVDLSRSSYTTVVNVTNRSTLTLFTRDALGTETPVEPSALKFRFRNGTVVNATHPKLTAKLSTKKTTIKLPADTGKVGYTAQRNGKQFSMPVTINGSYAIELPPGARVGVPLLSQAGPADYATTVTDNEMTLRWTDLERGTVQVRYYLQRDLLLFGGLIALALSIGVGGAVYYLRQIRRLEKQREEMGIDVDYDDDPRDEGPPPGMR